MPFIELSGAKLYYELAGEGAPAFVLIHGGLCNLRDWSSQIADLARDHAVLALDLRGHGRSTGDTADCHIERYAADVNALIDALGLAPAVLVGHSLASRIVAEVAWQRPDNAAALILLDGSRSHGGFSASAPADPTASPPMQGALTDMLNLTIGPYADDAIRAYVLDGMASAPPELLRALVDTMRDWDVQRADKVFTQLPERLPVLAIQSSYHDQFTPRRGIAGETDTTPYLAFLRSVRPGIAVKILTDTGHFSMLERPDRVTTLIRDFGRQLMQIERGE